MPEDDKLEEAKYLAEQARWDSTDRTVSKLADALLYLVEEVRDLRAKLAAKTHA